MNIQIVREYAMVARAKRVAEAGLRDINKQLAKMEPVIQNEMVSAGVNAVPLTVDGERVRVFLHSIVYPKYAEGVDKEQVIEVLKHAGPECRALVAENYNANSLAAWVRERLGDREKPLPPTLAAVLEITERTSVRVVSDAQAPTKSARAKATLAKTAAKTAGA